MEKGKEKVAQAQNTVPTLSCEQFQEMEKRGDDYIVLDVREEKEVAEGKIDGAVHIPRGFLEFRVEETIPEKDTKIIVCCASGGRAALAAETLLEMGYSDVSYLEGGYVGYCELQN